MSDLMRAVTEIRDAHEDYEIAEAYFEGDIPEVFCNPKIKRLIQKTGEEYSFNLAKIPVKTVANRLSVSSVAVQGSTEATRILQERVWKANKLQRGMSKYLLRACEYGDAYVFVWDGSEPGTVQVIYNSPKSTRVFYDAETETVPLFAAKLWRERQGVAVYWRCTLFYADRIERYVTQEGAAPEAEESWSPYIDSEDMVWPEKNPYGRLPVFHLRTDDPYGRPVHKDAYGPQNAVTKELATQLATTDYQGFPQRYALMNPTVGSETDGSGVDWGDDDADSDDVKGEKSKLVAGPGQMWELTGATGVGEFSAADPKNFIEPAQFYMRMMAQLTDTPLHYFDPMGDAPSGESLRVAEAPLDKNVGDLQESFTETIADISEFALAVLGIPTATVDVTWTPRGAVQDKESWEVVGLKVANGVPLWQALTEAGYTAEQLTAWGVPPAVKNPQQGTNTSAQPAQGAADNAPVAAPVDPAVAN
jgi:hypothetical protein